MFFHPYERYTKNWETPLEIWLSTSLSPTSFTLTHWGFYLKHKKHMYVHSLIFLVFSLENTTVFACVILMTCTLKKQFDWHQNDQHGVFNCNSYESETFLLFTTDSRFWKRQLQYSCPNIEWCLWNIVALRVKTLFDPHPLKFLLQNLWVSSNLQSKSW